ncbi:MAG: DUF402 domain-containing protein [Dehalococcoidia bacterium]|jgi:hypothetical protein|nr:DUF402 domain-containing protein [Dehalococcoidia bacterium]
MTEDAGSAASGAAGVPGARRWEPGETVVLRYLTRDGSPGMAWPYHVVEDRDDLLALHIPRGSTYKRWRRPPVDEQGNYLAARGLGDDTWRRDVLRLMFPGQHHSVWLFWSDDDERRFSAYYINMEEPFRRTSIGFDTNDHTLDIVVSPQFEWRWKDEEEMAERVRAGVYGVEFADAVRAEGERVIAALERRRSPFSDGWEQWAPPSNWGVPELPDGWDEATVELWDRREWAYGDIAR